MDIFITFFMYSLVPILAVGIILLPLKVLFKIFK